MPSRQYLPVNDVDVSPVYTSLIVFINATIDDEPRPGRVLDNIYQSFGRTFDRELVNLMGVLSKKGTLITSTAAEEEHSDVTGIMYYERPAWPTGRKGTG